MRTLLLMLLTFGGPIAAAPLPADGLAAIESASRRPTSPLESQIVTDRATLADDGGQIGRDGDGRLYATAVMPGRVARVIDGVLGPTLTGSEGAGRFVESTGRLFWSDARGVYRLTADRAASLWRPGPTRALTVHGHMLYAAVCPDRGPCTLERFDLKQGREGAPLGPRFDIVHDLAVHRGRLYVVGRDRDPREGQALSSAEMGAHVRFLQGRGTPPATMRYAPGFLAAIDLKTGETSTSVFADLRPSEVEAGPDGVYVTTDGAVKKGFGGGLLFRVTDGGYQVLAKGLVFPDRLRRGVDRWCWTAMPADRFEVQCHRPSTGRNTIIVSESWNVLDFRLDPEGVTWTTLSKGIFRGMFRPTSRR